MTRQGEPRRITIVGTSGSGKSTLAEQISARLGIALIDIDIINWQPGWRGLSSDDPGLFKARITQAADAQAWVAAGNYLRIAQPILMDRATDLVWLDYSRALVMTRVIRRSYRRALSGKELWPGTGNVEHFADWLDPEHPILWAWSTHAKHRLTYGALMASPPSHLAIHHLRHPRDADAFLAQLAPATWAPTSPN